MPPARADTACHVLVLGAGLAGMRAAWAAKEAAPALRVLLVCPQKSPCGSSFANRNNALGLQAPAEHEAPAFVDEALRLARPGFADPELVRALACDAPARLAELLDLGLAFRRLPGGGLARFSACFSTAQRAVIFDGLAAARAALLAKVHGLGVQVLHGYEALELLRGADGRLCGARLAARRGGKALTLRAGAVIAALGGPAPLFARRICGPPGVAVGGLAYGLLESAGAQLVNARYLQFFWGAAADGSFVNPGALPWPEEWAALAALRRGHCPVAYALPDAALDRALLARRGANGLVRPLDAAAGKTPGAAADQQPLALFAHAGNGGARIDAQGRTTTPGLYACGECAGGMHGAQRLGGGMVLSALVFGARAGAAAAQEAEAAASQATELTTSLDSAPAPGLAVPDLTLPDLTLPGLTLPVDAAFLRRLRRGMDRHAQPFAQSNAQPAAQPAAQSDDQPGDQPGDQLGALPGSAPGSSLAAFATWLRQQARQAPGQRQRLLARSALLVLDQKAPGQAGCANGE